MEGHFDRHLSHMRWWDLGLCIFSKLTHLCPLKYYLTHFIFTKIIKIVVSGCQILRLKCIKFDFGWDSASDPTGKLTALTALAGGAHAAPSQRPNPLLSALRASNFGHVGLEQLLLIRSSPSPTIYGSATGYTGMSKISLGVHLEVWLQTAV